MLKYCDFRIQICFGYLILKICINISYYAGTITYKMIIYKLNHADFIIYV